MLCQQSDRIGDRFKFPSLEYLYQFRVVICTFNTSGCFPRARDLNEKFNFSHFSHIFIDEAASVQMTVALIGIAGKYYFFIELLVELQSRLRFSCFVNLFFNYSIQCKYFFSNSSRLMHRHRWRKFQSKCQRDSIWGPPTVRSCS